MQDVLFTSCFYFVSMHILREHAYSWIKSMHIAGLRELWGMERQHTSGPATGHLLAGYQSF